MVLIVIEEPQTLACAFLFRFLLFDGPFPSNPQNLVIKRES
jgi:hypothetical protein